MTGSGGQGANGIGVPAASLLVVMVVVIAGCTGTAPGTGGQVPPEQVTVAYSPYESTALLWIARDRGFFQENGLNVTLRKYDSGSGSLDGVLRGEADMTIGVTEFPLVRQVFSGTQARALGVVDHGFFTYLVARKDRGIAYPADLRGKKIGTTIGTIAEFHLGRYLALHGMTLHDITLVDVKQPDDWVNAVADGRIDAIATAQPYADAARDRLGANAVVWPVQSHQPLYALVVSTDGWVKGHPDAAARLLRALGQADDFAAANPGGARAIVQKDLDLQPEYMDTVWSQNEFALSLDQSLITTMEDESRWMIRNNLTNATEVPDFRQYLYTDGLDTVKPGSVSIIR